MQPLFRFQPNLGNNLNSHPRGLTSYLKLTDLDVSLGVEQQVLRLEIPVYDAAAVQIVDGVDDAGDVEPGSRLPDGDSQIFRLYEFGPLGLKDYGSASLRCKV